MGPYNDRFGDAAWSAEAQLSMWEAVTSPFFSVSPTAALTDGFQARADIIAMRDIMLAHTSASAQTFVRSVPRLGEPDWSHIIVQLYVKGGYIGQAAGEDICVRPGDICILDLTLPLRTVANTFECITVAIPRDLAVEAQASLYHGRVIPAQTSTANMLALHLSAMSRNASKLTGDELLACAKAIVALISGHPVSECDQTRNALRATLKGRIVNYIDDAVGRRSVTPQEIADRFGISRASLYRLFYQDGGVRAFIKHRSLLRARNLLMTSAPSVPIEDIAFETGFATAAHFSRSFKDAFEMSPRDLRSAPHLTSGAAVPRLGSEAERWFGALTTTRVNLSAA